MPYNPGITDISGQLLGRGMESAAQARAQGINAIGGAVGGVMDYFAKKQEENKDLQAKSKAMENIISTHPEIFAPKGADGTPDIDKLSMFLQTDPNENLKQKYARLGSFLEGTITSKKMEQMAQEDQARKAQTALAMAQANRANYELEQQKAEEAAFKNFLGQRAQTTQPQDAGLNEAIANVAGPQAVPAGAGPSPSVTTAAAPSGGDWLSAATPPSIEDAAINLGKAPTGKNLAAVQTRQREMAKEWAAAQKRSQGYETAEGALAGARTAIAQGLVPAGTNPIIKRDANDRYYWETQTGTNPETEPLIRGRVKQAELLNEAAVKENEADVAAGRSATTDLAESAAIRRALSDPDLYTGTGAEYVNKLKKVGAAFGADVKGVASYDKLNALAGEQVLSRVAMLRPASDQDIKLLQEYGKSPNKTKEGNLALVNLTERAANYKKQKAEFINSLREADVDEHKIRIAKARWEAQHPLTLTGDEQNAIKLAISGVPSNSPIVSVNKSARISNLAKQVIDSPASADPVADMFNQLVKQPKK